MTFESDETQSLQKQLARLSARLEECEALNADGPYLRESFLRDASHALRTPLTVVKGYVQLLERLKSHDTDDPVQLILPALLAQVERMEHVLNDFLLASHLHHGRAEFRPEQTDLRDLLGLAAVTARRRRPHLPEHDVTLDAPHLLLGWFDRIQMESALRQLLYNAFQYSPQGGRVELNASEDRGWAVLSVIDYGIGIPQDEQDRIFLPFVRARNATLLGGAGLGLYIVAQVVALHGGDIIVRSAPSEGSNFTVRLPLTEAAADPLSRV